MLISPGSVCVPTVGPYLSGHNWHGLTGCSTFHRHVCSCTRLYLGGLAVMLYPLLGVCLAQVIFGKLSHQLWLRKYTHLTSGEKAIYHCIFIRGKKKLNVFAKDLRYKYKHRIIKILGKKHKSLGSCSNERFWDLTSNSCTKKRKKMGLINV